MTRRTRMAFLSPSFAAFAFAALAPAAYAQDGKPLLESERGAYSPSEEIVLRFEGRTNSVMDYLEVDRADGERLQSHVLGGPAESVEGSWRLDLPEGEYVARWYSPDDPDRAWSVAVRAEARFRVTGDAAAATDSAAGERTAALEGEPAPGESLGEDAALPAATDAAGDDGEPQTAARPEGVAGEEGASDAAVAEAADALEGEAAPGESPAVAPEDGDVAAAEEFARESDAANRDDDVIVAAADSWLTYRNARYGTSVTYPKDVFDVQSPPSEGTGRSFLSRDKQARLEIFAWTNDDGETPETLRARLLRAEGYNRVTYKPRGRNWIVLSGFRGRDVFYEKYEFDPQSDTIHAFAMQFPRGRKPFYAPILERVEDSFRPL